MATAEVKAAYIYESSSHPQNVLTTLNEQRKKGVLCDITVTVQGCDFKAHKAVLASCSSYFNTIITDPANISHNIVLELNCVTKIGMESLLEFAYTAKLALTKSTVEEIISAANELEFKNIEIPCLNFLKQQLQGKSNVTLPSSEPKLINLPCPYKKNLPSSLPTISDSNTNADILAQSSHGLTKSGDCPRMAKLSLESNPKKEEKSACPLRGSVIHKDKQLIGSSCKMKIRGSQSRVSSPPVAPPYSPAIGQSPCGTTYSMNPATPSCQQSGGSERSFGMSDYSSLCNSDTDDIGSGDEEGEACAKFGKIRKLPTVELPFTVKQITSMPRSELHDLLNKHPNLTAEQVNAIHEIRRRGKNRIAAQRCRKRKMDCVRMLMAEINVLREEHAALMMERRDACANACKLSEKFKATCEKLFKGEKKKKQEVVSNTGVDFEEQAKHAYHLAKKLEDWPTEDLPPRACPLTDQVTSDVIVVCDGDYKSCSPLSESSDAAVTITPCESFGQYGGCSSSKTNTCYMSSGMSPTPGSSVMFDESGQFNVVNRSDRGPAMSVNYPHQLHDMPTAYTQYSHSQGSDTDCSKMDVDCPVANETVVITNDDENLA